MTTKATQSIDVDFVLEQDSSELCLSIRTTDRSKLTQQDALDAFLLALEECFGTEVKTITQQDIEDDINLN